MRHVRTKGWGAGGAVLDENGDTLRTRKEMIRMARGFRQVTTLAEEKLWASLRGRKLRGLKFYRQKPIDRYVVDFYCPEKMLVIELDGGVHDDPAQREHDEKRTALFRSKRLRVLRFRNEVVEGGMEKVLEAIARACGASPPCPLSMQ